MHRYQRIYVYRQSMLPSTLSSGFSGPCSTSNHSSTYCVSVQTLFYANRVLYS